MLLKHRVFYSLLAVLLVFSLTACDFFKPIEPEVVEPLPPEAIPSLHKAYEGYFNIGVAVNAGTMNTHNDLIEKHFSSITAENEMKPDHILRYISGNELVLDFTRGDRIVNYALQNGKKVRGHVLVWHSQTPDWFFKDENDQLLSQEKIQERMAEYITKVVTHYKGKIDAWDVVNEAITDSNDPDHIYRHKDYDKKNGSLWNEIFAGSEIDYIAAAFRAAHEADPEAKLYYNDYNAVAPEKREKIMEMIRQLKDEDVPIHGIGIQAHWLFNWPSAGDIEDAIVEYSKMGLDVQITELDIRIDGDMEKKITLSRKDKERQADRYKEVFEIFIKHSDKISSVTFWGITDDNSWISQEPLIFDRNKNPKPAFWAILDALGK